MVSIELTIKEVKACYNFALKICKTKEVDVLFIRNKKQRFLDNFRGKMGELFVWKQLESVLGIDIQEPDFIVMEKGQWDKGDININGSVISVKTINSISSMFLLETKRFTRPILKNSFSFEDCDITPCCFIVAKVNLGEELEVMFKKYPNDKYPIWDDIAEKGRGQLFAEYIKFISAEDFWNIKKFIPRGATMKTALKICKNIVESKIPEIINDDNNEEIYPRWEYLQNNNFALFCDDLIPLDEEHIKELKKALNL